MRNMVVITPVPPRWFSAVTWSSTGLTNLTLKDLASELVQCNE
jgi:hypothetical protein